MNSRERLLAALSLRQPDRVPISTYELAGYNSRAFENTEPSYRGLMDVIREKTDCVCMWDQGSNQVAAYSAYPVRIDSDVERVENYRNTRLTLRTPRGQLTSSNRVYDDVYTMWKYERWCKNLDDVDTFLSIPFEPLTFDASDYARICAEVGDQGIIMSSLPDPVCLAVELMEFGEAMIWVMTETEHFAKVTDEFHRRIMINLETMLKSQVVDLYRICGPEYLTPPYLPTRYFSRFVTPYVREMTELIHRYGGRVRIHCHGRIRGALEDILSCGADAVDPCEPPPYGDIALGELKERTRGRLCLFGNLELRDLEHGSAGEIREIVRRCMDSAKEGGGYVIMPTAAPINIPLSPKTEENYRAFIDAALEFGRY